MATIFSAPILPVLTYANTFVDWFTTTNSVVVDFNNFTANAYAKNTGTLYLNEPTTALVVGNGVAQFGNQVQVTGTGSYLTVDNDIIINYGQLVVSNANSSIIAAGVVQVSNTIYANGPATSLFVANNTTLNSTAYITGNAYFGKQIFVTGPVTLNALTVLGATAIQNTLTISGTTNVNNTLTATGNVNALWFNATNGLTGTLTNISGYANSGRLVTTLTGQIGTQLYVGDSIYTTNNTFANINYSNTVVANTSVTTNAITSNTIQANLSLNTTTITATTGNIASINATTITTNAVNANNITAYQNLNANNLYANTIVSNTSILTPVLNVSTTLTANIANTYLGNVFAQNITVSGNLAISFPLVVTSNSFTLNANNTTAPPIAQFQINRGSSGNNAQIQWYESGKQWLINDVITNTFYPILTGEVTNNSILLNSTSNIATSNAVYTANLYTQSAYNYANSVNINTVAAFAFANAVNVNTVAAFAFANTVNVYSYASYASQNITATFANAAFSRANASANLFTGISGTATPTNGGITFAGANGESIIATGNTITIGTPQDVRITANMTLNSLTLTSNLTIANGGTGATTAAGAVQNLLPSTTSNIGFILQTTGPGNFGWISNTANNFGFTTPTGASASNNNVQLALVDVYVNKANIVSPAFTGLPTAPTAPTTTSNTVIATTAFVNALANSGYLQAHSISGYANLANSLYQSNFTSSGALHYQVAAGVSGFTAAGSSSQVLVGGANPVWSSSPAINITGSSANAAGLTGGTNGQIPYGQTGSTNAWLSLGTQNYVLTAGSSAPQYVAQSSLVVGTASNLAGTTVNGIPYQSASATTSYLSPSTGYLGWNGSSYTWGTVSSATSATTATNIAGGGAGQIPISTALNATGYIAAGSSGQMLMSTGSSASWTSNITPSFITNTGAYYGTSISVTGNITAYSGSDRKWKENIRPITGALDIVDAVGGKLFDWTDEYIAQNGGPNPYSMQKSDFGLVAQDLLAVFPVATRVRPDGSLAVDYEKLCAVAFAAIKDLRAEVEALKQSK